MIKILTSRPQKLIRELKIILLIILLQTQIRKSNAKVHQNRCLVLNKTKEIQTKRTRKNKKIILHSKIITILIIVSKVPLDNRTVLLNNLLKKEIKEGLMDKWPNNSYSSSRQCTIRLRNKRNKSITMYNCNKFNFKKIFLK